MQAAFFDLDKTVIAKASVPAFGRTLYDHGLISKRILIRAAIGHLIFLHFGARHAKLEKMRRSVLQIVRGWERDRMERIVREALGEVLEPIVYREALELIQQHQEAGRLVVIVSSAPQEIVRPLADFLGADASVASHACVDDRGRYTGELDFYAYAQAKADAIEEMAKERDIDLSESYAYSDSHTDVPMLSAVGHPVTVNPDKELMRIARANKWPISIFDHPLPMRDQRATFRLKVATAMLGASTVVLGTSLVASMRLNRRNNRLRNQLKQFVAPR